PSIEIRNNRLEQRADIRSIFRQEEQARFLSFGVDWNLLPIECLVKLPQKSLRKFQHNGTIRLTLPDPLLQPHSVITPHKGTISRIQNGFLSTFLDLQSTGTLINERMFPIFMSTLPIIGKIT